MKSRTSSFNLTVFKKDLTRFAPCWGAYLILLLLVLVNLADRGQTYYRIMNVSSSLVGMSWVNLFYAAVVAQLIFGDLYNSRLCNALHAMPVTRDGWFLTHSLSGLAFSLLPNLAITLVSLPVLRLEAGWPAAFWWLLGSELQYIFFFGTAVLCIMLSGNRLGQLALYAMIQFAGLAAYWLVSSFYEPLLYGIQFSEEPFLLMDPIGWMSLMSDMLVMDSSRIEDEFGNFLYYQVYGVAPGEGWGYTAICAAVGVAALVGALALYRKRKLECAGDFVAFKCMEPVVQVLVTVFAGGFFHLFGDVFGFGSKYVLVFCGMVVGYFACRMLLMRTNRVFQKRAFLGCGIIVLVFALTLGVVYLDPMGVTRWVPEADEVESITFSQSYSLSRHQEYPYTAAELEEIRDLLEVHGDCITREASSQPGGTEEEYYTMDLRLEYRLKNGKVVNRFYQVHPLSQAGQILKDYYTRPECVLGFPAEQAHEMAGLIRSIYVDGMTDMEYDLEELDLEGLMDAILADCATGSMVQFRGYHYPNNYDLLGEDYSQFDLGVCHLEIGWDYGRSQTTEVRSEAAVQGVAVSSYSSIRLFRSCVNTLSWLEENGLLTEEIKREMVEKYGGAYAEFAIPTGN